MPTKEQAKREAMQKSEKAKAERLKARMAKKPQKQTVDDVTFDMAKEILKARIKKEQSLTDAEIKQIRKRSELIGEQKKVVVDSFKMTIERENRMMDEMERRMAEAEIENRRIRENNKQRQKEFEEFKELHKGLIVLKPLIKVTHKIYENTAKEGRTIALFDKVQTSDGKTGVMCTGFVNIGNEPENAKELAKLACDIGDLFNKPKSNPSMKELHSAHEKRKENQNRRLQVEAEVEEFLSAKADFELKEAEERLRKAKEKAK